MCIWGPDLYLETWFGRRHDLHLETWSALINTICSCFVSWADVYSFTYLAIQYNQRQTAREAWSSHFSKYVEYPDDGGRASETSVHIYLTTASHPGRRQSSREFSVVFTYICIRIHGICCRYKTCQLCGVTILKESGLYIGELWTVQSLKVLMWAELVAADARVCQP
jgi:hypothetical protein